MYVYVWMYSIRTRVCMLLYVSANRWPGPRRRTYMVRLAGGHVGIGRRAAQHGNVVRAGVLA